VKFDLVDLINELRTYLDTQVITGDNIGDIRRQCFMPWSSEWNGIVRDETAQRERPADSRPYLCLCANCVGDGFDMFPHTGGK
jgi:hypothetical protein